VRQSDIGESYCGRCGQLLNTRDHVVCARQLELEPPRYCTVCRRRMVVQVTPDHWTARCVEHGETTASTWVSGNG
jgi:hypothetical protein